MGVNLLDVMVIIVVIEMRPGCTDRRLRASAAAPDERLNMALGMP
ncbi:hypothetical protein ACQP2U_12975 [Nocardia sp. CA-084685]